jgi:hypothetical protein
LDLGDSGIAVIAFYSFQGPPDGEYPFAGLIDVNGTLYGTTQAGGTSSY